MTAVVASIVIGLFEAAIEKVVALAILMPIVASMGANAGTQTLTVAVRAIAVKELTTSNAIKIITKETLIGGINGIIFAIIISLISIYWFDNLLLGLIIGLAMILNLLIAGFSGIVIPLVLDKLKIDPALASAVILTTITDVFGFLSFLGLATLFKTFHAINIDMTTVLPVPVANFKHSLAHSPSAGIFIPCLSDSNDSTNHIAVSTASN